MESLIRFIKIDIAVQRILIVIACFMVLMPVFLILALPLLGAWQSLSAMVIYSKLKDPIFKNHLIFSLKYIALMFSLICFWSIGVEISGIIYTILLLIALIIIPIYLATEYLKMTKETIKKLDGKIIEFNELELENILDAEEVLRNKKFEL